MFNKRKLEKLIEKDILFILIQIFSFIIIFLLIKNSSFIANLDLNFRKNFNNVITDGKRLNLKKYIVLIGIDEKFFSKENISIQGLHRGYYAKVIQNLKDAGVKTIGIDVLFEKKYFFKNDRYGKILNKIFRYYDFQLAKNLDNTTVLGAIYDKNKGTFIKPDEIFLQNGAHIGHVNSTEINLLNDINLGVYGKLYDKKSKQWINPLGLEIFLVYNHTISIQTGNFIYVPKHGIKIPLSQINKKNFIFIPFYTDKNWKKEINYISFYDVLYKTGDFNKINWKNKIVLIGATDLSLNDYKLSINGFVPGVLFHYNLIGNLLDKNFVYLLNNKQKEILILLTLIFNLIVVLLYRKYRGGSGLFYYLIGYTILSLFLGFSISTHISKKISEYYIFLPLGSLLVANSFYLITNILFLIIEAYITREWLQNLINIYIGKQISSKKTIGQTNKIAEKKQITIFFSDLVNFTNISEKLTAEETIKILNLYLEYMSNDISINKGFIDKYIGDAIMAFWEGNNGSDLAVKAAILNIQSLKKSE